MKINIDAKIHSHKYYRPMTITGAIASFVDTMEYNKPVVVDSVVDITGKKATMQQIRMYVNKTSKELGKKIVTRVINDELVLFFVK